MTIMPILSSSPISSSPYPLGLIQCFFSQVQAAPRPHRPIPRLASRKPWRLHANAPLLSGLPPALESPPHQEFTHPSAAPHRCPSPTPSPRLASRRPWRLYTHACCGSTLSCTLSCPRRPSPNAITPPRASLEANPAHGRAGPT